MGSWSRWRNPLPSCQNRDSIPWRSLCRPFEGTLGSLPTDGRATAIWKRKRYWERAAFIFHLPDNGSVPQFPRVQKIGVGCVPDAKWRGLLVTLSRQGWRPGDGNPIRQWGAHAGALGVLHHCKGVLISPKRREIVLQTSTPSKSKQPVNSPPVFSGPCVGSYRIGSHFSVTRLPWIGKCHSSPCNSSGSRCSISRCGIRRCTISRCTISSCHSTCSRPDLNYHWCIYKSG